MPQFVAPMMASVVKEPFDNPDWIFETKLDGFRAITVIDSAGKARLWSRNQLPLEPKFPMVLDAVGQLKLRSPVLDDRSAKVPQKTRVQFRSGSRKSILITSRSLTSNLV